METKFTIKDRLAKYISIVTSPYIVVPVFGLWIIGVYSQNIENFLLWGFTFIICVIVLPFFYIYTQMRSGVVSDLHVAIKEQRYKPFLISIIGSIILIGIYYIEHVPQILIILTWLLLINACIFLVATFFSKVSIHVASYAGSVFIVSRLLDHRLILLLLLLPLIIWARNKRERHTVWQSLSAGIIVIVAVFFTLYLFGL